MGTKIKIPDLNAMEKSGAEVIKGWGESYKRKLKDASMLKGTEMYEVYLKELKKPQEFQDLVPEKEFKLPSVKKGGTVLVFAGSFGDFSHKILNCNVIHTDALPGRVEIAKKKHAAAGKKLKYMVMSMYHLPVESLKIDWLYSFDPPFHPLPLFTIEALATAKKGIILHFSPHPFPTMERREVQYADLAREIYKANVYLIEKGPEVVPSQKLDAATKQKMKAFYKEMDLPDVSLEAAPVKTHFILVKSSSSIRKLALLDRKVIAELNRLNKAELKSHELELLRKKLKIRSKRSLKKSLERINALVEKSRTDLCFEMKIEI